MSRIAKAAIAAAALIVIGGIAVVGLSGYPRLAAGIALFVGAVVAVVALALLHKLVALESDGVPVAMAPSHAEVAVRAIRSRVRRERRRATPPELDHLHQFLHQATGIHAHATLPLRGVLRRIALIRLADRGLHLDDPADAEKVRTLLGPEAWELCGPAVTRRPMGAQNEPTSVSQLSAAVAALERL